MWINLRQEKRNSAVITRMSIKAHHVSILSCVGTHEDCLRRVKAINNTQL